MKLYERERIEGTGITIGRRVYYRGGEASVSRKYAAEYRDGSGKQVSENMGTTSRLEARRKAMAIHVQLQQGQPRVVDRNPLARRWFAALAFAAALGAAVSLIITFGP